jgi:hypothetical protein
MYAWKQDPAVVSRCRKSTSARPVLLEVSRQVVDVESMLRNTKCRRVRSMSIHAGAGAGAGRAPDVCFGLAGLEPTRRPRQPDPLLGQSARACIVTLVPPQVAKAIALATVIPSCFRQTMDIPKFQRRWIHHRRPWHLLTSLCAELPRCLTPIIPNCSASIRLMSRTIRPITWQLSSWIR